MKVAVGSDVESICRKCGDVWHVVVAMVEDTIVKVQCKECGGLHKYKSSDDAAAAAAPKPKKKRTTKAKSADEKPKTKATVEPNLSKPTRPYKFKDSYEVADRIDHPKFGVGVVETILDGAKIEVFFPEGRKVLAIAKDAQTLTPLSESRPAWLDELSAPKVE